MSSMECEPLEWENKTSLSLPNTHTNTHTRAFLFSATRSCKRARSPLRQQGKQTSFLTQSAALTFTLDANQCVTQSHRIQSIEHNSSLVSDAEQQWNCVRTNTSGVFQLNEHSCWEYPTPNTVYINTTFYCYFYLFLYIIQTILFRVSRRFWGYLLYCVPPEVQNNEEKKQKIFFKFLKLFLPWSDLRENIAI